MSVPSWVRAGQRVICIKGDEWQAQGARMPSRSMHPRRGEECTISRVVTDHTGTWLQLHGYNPQDIYHWTRFRPAVEDKSDNEIEAQIYRRRVHQKPVPIKSLERT